MKTIKIISVVLIILTIGFSANAKDSKKDLLNENLQMIQHAKMDISSKIKYPEEAKQMMIEGLVCASIKIDGLGNVKVTGINGHSMFIDSIREQLEHIDLSNSQYSGALLLKMNFEIL